MKLASTKNSNILEYFRILAFHRKTSRLRGGSLTLSIAPHRVKISLAKKTCLQNRDEKFRNERNVKPKLLRPLDIQWHRLGGLICLLRIYTRRFDAKIRLHRTWTPCVSAMCEFLKTLGKEEREREKKGTENKKGTKKKKKKKQERRILFRFVNFTAIFGNRIAMHVTWYLPR